MTATSNKIETALQILKSHDWYWCMADYTTTAYGKAYGSMRTFVELVESIEDRIIIKALRDLWTATYEYVRSTMFGHNDETKARFKAREAELLAIIKPTYSMAA